MRKPFWTLDKILRSNSKKTFYLRPGIRKPHSTLLFILAFCCCLFFNGSKFVRVLVPHPANDLWIGATDFLFIKAWGGRNAGHFNRRKTQVNRKCGRKFIDHSPDAALVRHYVFLSGIKIIISYLQNIRSRWGTHGAYYFLRSLQAVIWHPKALISILLILTNGSIFVPGTVKSRLIGIVMENCTVTLKEKWWQRSRAWILRPCWLRPRTA